MYVAAKALENAQSADRDALRDALATVKLERSAGDRITIPLDTLQFDATGQLAENALYMGEILGGELDVRLPGAADWKTFQAGQSFEVAANAKFSLKVKVLTDYCCSYIA